jgi:FKBP-type peptidyl-prolyl cis-trans isomerase SlyD
MEIGKDTFVILEYRLKLDDGSYIKGDPESGMASLNYIVGYDQLLPALEQRLLGVAEGSQVDLVIPCEEAFGAHQADLVEHRDFQDYPLGKELTVGKWVVALNESTKAQYSYFVKEKSEDAVVLDFNHPLAGKSLNYTIRVVKVRPATAEELAYLRPCQTDQGTPQTAQ